MSNALAIVATREISGKSFTIYGDAEKPLFLAKDVAKWIEHSDVSMMLRAVDEDEKLVQTMFVSGQNRECAFLTENGLYEVLMLSRKPVAKQFKREVKRILHEIRTTGRYAVQPELPGANWIEYRGEKLLSGSELAGLLGLRESQLHGILCRHRIEFIPGTDIVKYKRNYFTASGVAKVRELAAVTALQPLRASAALSGPSGTARAGECAIRRQFEKMGFTYEAYLTCRMLLCWYNLDRGQMKEAVAMLDRSSRCRTRELPALLAAVAAADAIVRIGEAVEKLSSHCFSFAGRSRGATIRRGIPSGCRERWRRTS
ncbi:Bro-N domain-containing protein [Victivallis vadensis]|uniref:BRO-N domain-containing protein n=1 Tax=Victivallis vadensis TaxID=172901 RepID=UPI003AF9A31C